MVTPSVASPTSAGWFGAVGNRVASPRRCVGGARRMARGACTRTGRIARAAVARIACLTLAHCASSDKVASRVDPRYGVASSPRVVNIGDPVPKGGGAYRVGKPYAVAGRVYVPEEDTGYRAEGLASWYGEDFHGRLTA